MIEFQPPADDLYYWWERYLGEKVISSGWAHSTSDRDMEWLQSFIIDTEGSLHPEMRMEIMPMRITETIVIRPTNPKTLDEVIG